MNYGNLTERLDRDQLEMIEDIQKYIVDTMNLKGDARTSAEGIMNSSFGDMQELEDKYGRLGVEGAAEYVVDNLPKAAVKKYLNESMQTLNEGQFSWFTQDTNQQIGSEKQNTIDVWMYDNEGNSWYEDRYEGYGVFGGMDYYELVAKMNGYTDEDLEDYKGTFKEMRSIGIDLAFGKLKTKHKGRKTLFPALSGNARFNWKRHDFTEEAESDPNQSWYQEEYDEYEEEYYENKHVPSYLKFVNENLKK